ncbi:MAG: glycosyltransferase family 9 protein [Acidobacteria bacterium]|nr:glycosyltransferase family 9 protein [Acidobacteriota bacterium]
MSVSTLRDARDILVCLRYGIGDVVTQLPVLDALRRAAPKARITAAGAARAIELLDGAGLADEIVAYGRWGIQHLWDLGAAETAWQIATWLEEVGFDVVLDGAYAPEPIREAVTLTRLPDLSADEAVLRAALAGGANASEGLSRAAGSGWGLPVYPHARPTIVLSNSEREFAREFRNQSGSCGPLVGFCPAASSNLKRWPGSRFAAVADWVIENGGHGVVLFGGDLDESVAAMRRLMSHGARGIVVRGLHLRRVAAVLAECAALVSNDTGLMHMAAAVDTPVIAVFGPTSPRVYLPRGRTLGLASDLDCSHRSYNMSPPRCWESQQCLIRPDNCTFTVHAGAVIASLQGVLRPSAAAIPTLAGSSLASQNGPSGTPRDEFT